MYRFDQDDAGCLTVEIDERKILLDGIKELKIIYFTKSTKNAQPKWLFDDEGHMYVLNTNNKKIYFLEILFEEPFEYSTWDFKNGNKSDLRRENLTHTRKKATNFGKYKVPEIYEVLQQFEGHVVLRGQDAGSVFNPYWLVKNKTDKATHYLMYCEKDTYCLFSEESLDDVLHVGTEKRTPTWYKTEKDCITSYVKYGNDPWTTISMDRYLLKCHMLRTNQLWDDDKGVDHINDETHDNRIPNLRLVTKDELKKKRPKGRGTRMLENSPKVYSRRIFPST